MSENGKIYTADKNFTLPPALTAWTNSTSEDQRPLSLILELYHKGGSQEDEKEQFEPHEGVSLTVLSRAKAFMWDQAYE